jgi:hypothetical protein
MGYYLRFLRKYRGINVQYLVTAFGGNLSASLQKDGAITIAPLRIVVREVLSDITFSGSSQYRITDCMKERICIRMALKAAVEWNVYSAQDKAPAGNQPVNVETSSNAKWWVSVSHTSPFGVFF